MQIQLYHDRTLKSLLPTALLQEMEKRDLIVVNDKHTITFVGALIHDDCINVFLPRSYSVDINTDADKYQHACLTMNAVEKFGRTSRTKLNNLDKGSLVQGELNLSLVKTILNDFQQYGLYARRHKETHLNTGKPDWKKTVNRFLPFISKSGAPVYLDYFSKKSRYSTDNIVSEIHAEIVAYLDTSFAWWITGNHKHKIAPELNAPNNVYNDADLKLSVLKHELSLVYSDRDIRLINDLIEFIQQTEGHDNSLIITGLKDFHNAWEAMLRDVCEGVIELNGKLPKPTYVTTDDKAITASGMLTDIIIENDAKDKIAIIDAKYYSAKTVENSPHWPDIVKQFYYEKAVEVIKPHHEISNYFAFPGVDGTFSKVEMVGQADGQALNNVFKPIKCIYVCPAQVMTHYLNDTNMLSFDDLM